MITILVLAAMISMFGGLVSLAFKFAWSMTKIVFGVILFPLFLLGLCACGLVYIALPIIVIAGLVVLLCAIA